jgi:hypothetical protein
VKKIFAIVPLVFSVFAISFLVRNYLSSPSQVVDTNQARGSIQNLESRAQLIFKNTIYESNWIILNSTDNLSLINNLYSKLISSQIVSDNNCKYLISAGFYTEDGKPVGYLKTDSGIIRNYTNNTLFNSVLTVNYLETPRITRNLPQDEVRIGVQTGPFLIENANELQYDSSDDPARRIIAGVTGENKLVFIVIYTPDSTLLGPKLSDLPEILRVWEEKSGIVLADATNLDGGSASAFITENFKLVESSKVGSFFCYR